MELQKALEVLDLGEEADFETVRTTYYTKLKKLLTPNGEHWLNFKEEADKVTAAYFAIICSDKYNKEVALINFWKIVRTYNIKTEDFIRYIMCDK